MAKKSPRRERFSRRGLTSFSRSSALGALPHPVDDQRHDGQQIEVGDYADNPAFCRIGIHCCSFQVLVTSTAKGSPVKGCPRALLAARASEAEEVGPPAPVFPLVAGDQAGTSTQLRAVLVLAGVRPVLETGLP